MNVYLVLSEMFEDGGNSYGDPPEPPEWGRLALIVAAATRNKARYLAMRSDRTFRHYGPVDWPKTSVRKLGTVEVASGLVEGQSADAWWNVAAERGL